LIPCHGDRRGSADAIEGGRALRPWLLAAACVGGCATATPPPEAVDWALERSNGGARMTAADADGPLLQLSCSGGGLAV
jgi:hypothetical protein